jgi:hypothetical protein
LGIFYDRQAPRAKIRNIAPTAKSDEAELRKFIAIVSNYANYFHNPETRGARSRLLAYASLEVRTAYWQMIADDTALGLTVAQHAITLWIRFNTPSVAPKMPKTPEDLKAKTAPAGDSAAARTLG